MKKISAIVLGAGARGARAYAPYALKYPHELEIAAVAEPSDERRTAFAHEYSLPQHRVYSNWQEVLEQERFADAIIVSTQDRMHFEPTMRALEKGYHVLLEKPMSPSPEECIRMAEASKRNDRLLTVCHVLRYSPFWSAIKAMIEDGKIGDVVSVQLNENVGYFHMAHSFVRGNWRNARESSPMILAKSCHDMDILLWLVGQDCTRVSSYGSLFHFHEGNAPEGSTDRCTDGCLVEHECPYSAPRFYLNAGDRWKQYITEDLSGEGVIRALKEGPYGRCVYRTDNDVVDHQVVNLEFANGSTATFSMCGFTHDSTRGVQIMGTHGEIRGYMETGEITLHDFVSGDRVTRICSDFGDRHGGGDEGIMRRFLRDIRTYSGQISLTSADVSLQSHLMAFAAEQSRKAAGQSIELESFKQSFISGAKGAGFENGSL
ncbi:Gfo/Idh/MocA family protein [Paenibacillus beijingensis]|uniref:Oxidoreductase n=1 Tax=Paenibacillus beijingensis TaxID=1126833 RepID=A0A0D5NF69_9BACL|nr:Gfo/Idh/MocA family oxidoreductase [Paenibacillus beijingensis]AJY73568.1 oxidoreductase [Paenibacillus beijingensis]